MTDKENAEVKADLGKKEEISSESLAGMSNKDIRYRAKYKETVSELETFKAAAERSAKELEAKISDALKAKEMSDSRRIEAEIKAMAVSEGLTDLDLIKLVDMSAVKIDSNGEVAGVKEAIEEFKAKKPAFFGTLKKTSTSTNSSVPGETKKESSSAFDIPKDQWDKLKRHVQTVSM